MFIRVFYFDQIKIRLTYLTNQNRKLCYVTLVTEVEYDEYKKMIMFPEEAPYCTSSEFIERGGFFKCK